MIRAQWKCCGDPHSIITTAYYEDGTVLEDNSRYNRNEIWEWGIYDEEKDDIESQKDGGTVTIISMKKVTYERIVYNYTKEINIDKEKTIDSNT